MIEHLLQSLSALTVDIFIVSNEVGLGVIPMGESTRLYVDFCGWLNQGVAKLADKVTLITAGIPLVIKDTVDN
jgi:adenosylcobinamide kinase/adenosylcobinamide-phosphate guanylyltransferase